MTSEEHGKLRPLGRDYLAGTSNVLLEQLGVTDAQEEVLINGIIALFGPPFYDEAPGERLVLHTPGGGGLGPVAERNPVSIVGDLANELVSGPGEAGHPGPPSVGG